MSKEKTKESSFLFSLSKFIGKAPLKLICLWSLTLFAPMLLFGQNDQSKMYIDVHQLEPGGITFADIAAVHEKDLATQEKYDVHFIKFWVDEAGGKVYCLSEAKNPNSIYKTHKEAHGAVPTRILQVSEGQKAPLTGGQLFLDIHRLGAGSVTPEAVAAAHQKDLALEGKYGVNFINYWLDEKEGIIYCLSEAPNESAIISTHTEAHGLVPAEVIKVQEGE